MKRDCISGMNMTALTLAVWLTSICTIVAGEVDGDSTIVRIDENLPYYETYDSGKRIRVERIQSTDSLLTDDFSKTSRECPPYCIQPIEAAEGVTTVGERELIDFTLEDIPKGALLLDVRDREWYGLETIPASKNIPLATLVRADDRQMGKILSLLGADGKGDFSHARKLMIFGNGPWSDEAVVFIEKLISLGYPAEKILFYRDGLQGWKLLGLTTVSRTEKENDK